MSMQKSKDIMGIFVGHDHDNDYAGCLQGICLAYGRKTGFESYGSMEQGARVINLKEGKREFDSCIITGEGKILNQFHYPKSFE